MQLSPSALAPTTFSDRPSIAIARTLITAVLALLLTPLATAQSAPEAKDQGSANQKPTPSTPKLPAGLLPVGEADKKLEMEMGLSARDAAKLAEDTFPKSDAKREPFLASMRVELGEAEVEFSSFYLARHPVTNAEYKAYVDQTGTRYPFHWWRHGRKDDFDSDARIEEMRGENPIDYWKANWQDLPWQIPEGEENFPVIYVEWQDAIGYAAWAGCRLPFEHEWTYAMTGGDRERNFLWGPEWKREDFPWSDKEFSKTYRKLQGQLNPVGAYGDRFQGPFGHQDVNAQVWEWMWDPAYRPIGGDDEWRKEMEQLERMSVSEGVEFRTPKFGPFHRVLKGASCFGIEDVREARLFTRKSRAPETYTNLIGFRLAKSYAPARDHAEAALKLDYVWSYFGGDRHPNFEDHVGAERYELDNGNIAGYYAASIVPVSHYAEKQTPQIRQFLDECQETPAILGTLATSMPISVPKLDRGFYTLTFRKGGIPKDLAKDLKDAQRDIAKLRRKQKNSKDGEEEDDKPAGPTPDWVETLRRYGVTEDEALEHGAGIEVIRLMPGNLEVPVKETIFAVRDKNGKYVAHFPADDPKSQSGYDPGDGTVRIQKVTKSRKWAHDGEVMLFEFGVPVNEKGRGKVFRFEVPLLLPQELAGGDSWRLPPAP